MNAQPMYLATTVAWAIADGLTCEEISRLGMFLTVVGDQLSLLAVCCPSNAGEEKRQDG